jgi:hypothetical protein
MSNRFLINTELEGYINALQPGGKFNKCSIGFRIPSKELEQMTENFESGLKWAETKAAGKRVSKELPKWDDEGFVSYNYGGEQGAPMFPWVDSEGKELDINTDVRKGTKVRLIVDLKPYIYGNKIGVSLKVKGARVLELVTGNGAVDSGDLSAPEVAALLGIGDGFKQSEPNVKDGRAEPESDAYEF